MSSHSVVSPEDQSVNFVELFFDLVFVFALTQIVGLLHDHVTWVTVGQAVLVFWLVWWAWTQFTWALNAADTTHHLVILGTLLATGIAFFMAVALPDAFQGRGLAFVLPYVLVRVIGLALYIYVTKGDPEQGASVRTFALLSSGGLVAALAGGFAGGALQYWLWGMAILMDVVAANVGGQAEYWNLHPGHFGERHGLFVIIALGETLIVTASGVSVADWRGELLGVAVLAVATTCALWWSYFHQALPTLEHALQASRGAVQSEMARDVFSLIHFPMLCGIIAYAVAVEEAVAHPADPLPALGRLLLTVGLLLFVGGMVGAVWRATGKLLLPRLLLIAGTAAALLLVTDVSPLVSFAIALVGILVIAVVEHLVADPSGGPLAPIPSRPEPAELNR